MPNIILKINGIYLRMGQGSPQHTLETIYQMEGKQQQLNAGYPRPFPEDMNHGRTGSHTRDASLVT